MHTDAIVDMKWWWGSEMDSVAKAEVMLFL